jgi:hypothetical protein
MPTLIALWEIEEANSREGFFSNVPLGIKPGDKIDLVSRNGNGVLIVEVSTIVPVKGHKTHDREISVEVVNVILMGDFLMDTLYRDVGLSNREQSPIWYGWHPGMPGIQNLN